MLRLRRKRGGNVGLTFVFWIAEPEQDIDGVVLVALHGFEDGLSVLILVCEAWIGMRTGVQYQIVVVWEHCPQLGYLWVDRAIAEMLLWMLDLNGRGGGSIGRVVDGGYGKGYGLGGLRCGHGDGCRFSHGCSESSDQTSFIVVRSLRMRYDVEEEASKSI